MATCVTTARMNLPKSVALLASLLLLASLSARAVVLVGTQVTGTFNVPGGLDYFDPANGLVGNFGGSLNQAGTTVAISSTAIEFGLQDSFNRDSADFTGTQLIVSDDQVPGRGSATWIMTFTDTAFSGLTLSKVSDNFVDGGVTGVLNGDVITVTWPGELTGIAGNQSATFNLVPIPEPGTLGLLGLGLLSLAGLKRFKRRAV
jgi:hypothetical protein